MNHRTRTDCINPCCSVRFNRLQRYIAACFEQHTAMVFPFVFDNFTQLLHTHIVAHHDIGSASHRMFRHLEVFGFDLDF